MGRHGKQLPEIRACIPQKGAINVSHFRSPEREGFPEALGRAFVYVVGIFGILIPLIIGGVSLSLVGAYWAFRYSMWIFGV
jgi:high-affinity K+ transport system ATPase subunit B